MVAGFDVQRADLRIDRRGLPHLAPRLVRAEADGNGTVTLRSELVLGPVAPTVVARLGEMARRYPDRDLLRQRRSGVWQSLTYAEAYQRALAVAAALIEARSRVAGAASALILADNSIEHAVFQLGCLIAAVPTVPAAPAYLSSPAGVARLREVSERLQVRFAFLQFVGSQNDAAKSVLPPGTTVFCAEADPHATLRVIALTDLGVGAETPAMERQMASVGPDTIAKLMLTSGSTGEPKAVLTTHRMLCVNQAMIASLWPFVTEISLVLCDWLPWTHTFGGSHTFNLVLFNGGTLYIDDGRPVAGGMDRTVANLIDAAPTVYFNVPQGYARLLQELKINAVLRQRFFERLHMANSASAALPRGIRRDLERLALQSRGRPLFMSNGWGSTETAPVATLLHFESDDAANIGLPPPGCELRLLPRDGNFEVRVRGAHVTPGYIRAGGDRHAACDADGYYCTGDAVSFLDPQDPARGLVFRGRLTENFKMSSGTWVRVDELRTLLLSALAPLALDVVPVGPDQDFLAVLIWPDIVACERGLGADWRSTLRGELTRRLSAFARIHRAGSTRIVRALVLDDPADASCGEITDKGYVNQQRARETRRADIARIYGDPLDPAVMQIP